MTTKICSRCKIEKPLEEFSVRSSSPDGKSSWCRSCHKAYRDGYFDLRDVPWSSSREARLKQKRERERERKYGLPIEAIREMAKKQNNRCTICSSEFEGEKYCVDHCHISGVVRELLCTQCNVMIAMARDNPLNLMKGVEYLFRHRGSSSEKYSESEGKDGKSSF